MRESEYRAMYEAVRHRALHDDVGLDPTWFPGIKNQLDAVARMVDEDTSLSSNAKRRLAVLDADVLRIAVGKVHAAYMQAVADMLDN